MNPKSAKLIDGDLKAISVKLKAIPSDSKEAVYIVNLISTARYLLKSLLGSTSSASAKPVRKYVPDPSDDEAPDSEDEDDAHSKRRNLRVEMAGKLPLPPVAKMATDSLGRFVRGRDPDDYESVDGHPNSVCPDCNAPIYTHPADENAKLRNGYPPRIACDATRVYVGRVD